MAKGNGNSPGLQGGDLVTKSCTDFSPLAQSGRDGNGRGLSVGYRYGCSDIPDKFFVFIRKIPSLVVLFLIVYIVSYINDVSVTN